MLLCARHSPASYGPCDEDEDDRPDRCDDDRSQESSWFRSRRDQAHEPSADDRADEAEDEITDQTVAASFHDLSGEPAGDEPDDDPHDDSQAMPPSAVLGLERSEVTKDRHGREGQTRERRGDQTEIRTPKLQHAARAP